MIVYCKSGKFCDSFIFALNLATAKTKTREHILYMSPSMEQKSKIANKKTSELALNWLTAKIYMRGNYHFIMHSLSLSPTHPGFTGAESLLLHQRVHQRQRSSRRAHAQAHLWPPQQCHSSAQLPASASRVQRPHRQLRAPGGARAGRRTGHDTV